MQGATSPVSSADEETGTCACVATCMPGPLRVRAARSEEEQEPKENLQRGIVPRALVRSSLSVLCQLCDDLLAHLVFLVPPVSFVTPSASWASRL